MTMLSQITAAGGAGAAVYVEDVFSTYIYQGDGNTRTITNNIDLSTKGGLVWVKSRSNGTYNHMVYDTARGASSGFLSTNTTAAAYGTTYGLTAFGTSGFNLSGASEVNQNSSVSYTSWAFRKQAKFFDTVTWTGDGTSNQVVPHSLTSQPGFILIKSTDYAQAWTALSSDGAGNYILTFFNTTAASPASGIQSNVASSSNLNVGWLSTNWVNSNAVGKQYVAYIFASNAGGFGLNGTDNVISCGYGTAASGTSQINVTLGYEPQWILMKNATAGSDWWIWDPMRGIGSFDIAQTLFSNNTNSENTYGGSSYPMNITSTGFSINTGYLTWGSPSDKFIYVAIRKGPMKVPTDGTTVFSPISSSATTGTQLTTNFPVDSQIIGFAPGGVSFSQSVNDRLRGVSTTGTASGNVLGTASSAAEGALGSISQYWSNTGFQFPPYFSGQSSAFWSFRRAPKFFDQVCYTGIGAGSANTINHNLTVAPEFAILKSRSNADTWIVYSASLGSNSFMQLNSTASVSSNTDVFVPTSTTFTVTPLSNTSSRTYVAYLFATCAGVSKVGSYTGTGTTLQINCGFTAGARFVLIKRTDSTGDWYVWDSARGIVSGNDPYLLMNSNAAEVTSTDYVDTYAAGFELSSTAPAALNASGGTFIFLAIA